MVTQGMTQWTHAGELLVACLAAQGVDRVFQVPGESFLAALDGFHDAAIRVVTTRHESGATMMAEAEGKLTNRPGIAFVTRGPGATNASAGVHIARQDSTPMILFIGQVARDQRDREAFQEVDYRAMYAPLSKWVAEIDDAARIPEYVSRAFHEAQSGRPGPVVLALPEDMLSGPATGTPAPAAVLPSGKASDEDVAAIHAALATATRPVIVAGGSMWSAEAADALARYAETAGLPVATTFRRQDHIDNAHPNFVGDFGIGPNPDLEAHVKEADTLLLLGARFSEITTGGYTRLTPPVPSQHVIHVYPDPSEAGRVYRPTLSVAARADQVIQQLAHLAAPGELRGVQEARASYDAWSNPPPSEDDLSLEHVVTYLRTALPDDAILTNGAGNYAVWFHRYFKFHSYGTQLAPTSGSMGYGLPAAVAAKLRHPERDVICAAGDGCFQMTQQEFGTACQEGANIIVLVVDNGRYGTIRMHQERHYPDRVSGTVIRNPDFAALARSYGGFGATVTRDEEFAPALAEARAAGVPAILHLKVSRSALSPSRRLD